MANCRQMERLEVPNRFLNTAIRVTAVAFLVVLTLCVASFGLSQLSSDSAKVTTGPKQSLQLNDDPVASSSPDPLTKEIARLGDRLDEITARNSDQRSTRDEISRLADTVQDFHQQSSVTGNRLQQELSSLRVDNEVELRDLNRKIDSVSSRSQQLERELIEQRAGVLSALETQRAAIANQVDRLEGGLDDVHSELSDLRNQARLPLAADGPQKAQAFSSQNGLKPVPRKSSGGARSAAKDTAWKEPIVLDSSFRVSESASGKKSRVGTAAQNAWDVSPMSHSVPADGTPSGLDVPPQSLPLVPPVIESGSAILPPLPEPSKQSGSGLFEAPLKATLSPQGQNTSQRVPEIIEPLDSKSSPIEQVGGVSSSGDSAENREYAIQTTVIHVAASRPVDAEPGGVRMLNPRLLETANGEPWTHDSVARELLRKVSQQAEAQIVGKQTVTIHSGSNARLTIGSSCLHCNEVNGFEAGDRLIVKAESGSDQSLKFLITSEIAGGSGQLQSIPDVKLTPGTGGSYVISEEAIEGSVEETVAVSDEQLVPIHGVLAPDTGSARTREKLQFMQRLVVLTFRDRSSAEATGETVSPLYSESSQVTSRDSSTPVVLPVPAPAENKKSVVRELTPVDNPPVFLPPPAPEFAIKAPKKDSDVELAVTRLSQKSYPKVWQTGYQKDEDFCEVCQQKHGQQIVDKSEEAQPADSKHQNPLANWFRRVQGEATESESGVTNAEFSTETESELSVFKVLAPGIQRRYVTKPGNRRPVR